MAPQTMEEVSDANFDSEVLQSAEPTIVEFWAPWSSASQATHAGFETVAADFVDEVRATRLNVDDNPQMASNFSVTNLPTFVLFVDGKAVARINGSASRKRLRTLFERVG